MLCSAAEVGVPPCLGSSRCAAITPAVNAEEDAPAPITAFGAPAVPADRAARRVPLQHFASRAGGPFAPRHPCATADHYLHGGRSGA